MEQDTCSPNINRTLKIFRIWTILIPCVSFILLLEIIFVFITYPSSLSVNMGNITSILTSRPYLELGESLFK